MERHEQAGVQSKRRIQIADHMLTVTYPLLKDTKLLLAVLENVFLAITSSMAQILHFERRYKNIPPFHDNFESKYNMFRAKIIPKYDLSQDYEKMIDEVQEIMVEHKHSPVEFSRKDKFVICSDDYDIKTVDLKKITGYVKKTKSFVHEIDELVRRNDRVLRERA